MSAQDKSVVKWTIAEKGTWSHLAVAGNRLYVKVRNLFSFLGESGGLFFSHTIAFSSASTHELKKTRTQAVEQKYRSN